MGSPYISSYGEEAAFQQRLADLEAANNGGSSPVGYLQANQTSNATLSSTETPVPWTQNLNVGGIFAINADGSTFDCIADCTVIVYAEPQLVYTVGASSQGAHVFVYLRPNFADGDALGNYINNQWDYWFVAENKGGSFYQSYSSAPLKFAAGDSFHIGAGVLLNGGDDSVVSNTAHSIAIVRIA